ncbi:MAG: hypothetical protein IT372_27965 [Polyangiaceae bacterium]|nr:hypothetical protein [Polyangiaceae bacterium]
MRIVRPSSAALALLLGLASSIVLAQSPPAPPAAPAKEQPPAASATAAAAAPTATAAPAAPAAPAAAAGPAKQTGAATAQAGPAKPAAQARPAAKGPGRKGRKIKDLASKLEGPVATYPGFRMLPDGSSRVFVQVSPKVDVTESKAEGRLVYRMKGARAIQTNQFALVTSFFPTPVGRVQLVDQGADLDLVIDLRIKTDSRHRVLETDSGIVVQVDFPALPPGTQLTASVPKAPAEHRKGKAKRVGKAPDEGEDDGSF